MQHKNKETFKRKRRKIERDRRKYLEMGVLNEGIERITHKNP